MNRRIYEEKKPINNLPSKFGALGARSFDDEDIHRNDYSFDYSDSLAKKYGPESDDDIPEMGDLDISLDDGMVSVCDLVRELFKNVKLDADVEYDELDISIYVFLQKKEKIRSLMRAFEVVYKLQKDVLAHYDCEVELYENKEGYPILAYQFYADSVDKSKDEDPFV